MKISKINNDEMIIFSALPLISIQYDEIDKSLSLLLGWLLWHIEITIKEG